MEGTELATIDSSVESLSNLLKQQINQQSENNQSNQIASITIKLNDRNYSLWSRLVRIVVGGRGRLSHLTGHPPPPSTEDPNFTRWEQNDLTVFSWIIQAIEADLVANFVEYSTAKDLWNGLAATYSSGGDGLQIFDLTTKSSRQQQGSLPLENFYSVLQGYWREIDRRQPNPMKCPDDINTFNRLKQETRLFQFLAGINDQFDAVKRDLLRETPLPSIETAYATVRREAARLQILNPTEVSDSTNVGSGMAARGRQGRTQKKMTENYQSESDGAQKNYQSDSGGATPKSSSWTSAKGDWSTVVCSHCRKPRHTKEGCFEIIGYPEWWDSKKRMAVTENRKGGDRAAAAMGNATHGGTTRTDGSNITT